MLIHVNEGFGSFVISPYLPFMCEFWYGEGDPNTGNQHCTDDIYHT
jgi:hypothetical protein